MKPLIVILAMILALQGCVAGSLSLPRDEGARWPRLEVVAMEAPPLRVPPHFESAVLGFLPKYPIEAARVGGVVTSVMVLAEMPAAGRRAGAASKKLEELLSRGEPWAPTRSLAREAAALLTAAGKPQVSVQAQLEPIPDLANREYTFWGENWSGPIRAWYRQTESTVPYQAGAEKVDAVVEVGLCNYEITSDNKLLLQVMVKVVDPASRVVRGRARASAHPALGALDQAFADGGRRFKEIFQRTGKELLAQCFKEMGLI